jgi:hypothetical protein
MARDGLRRPIKPALPSRSVLEPIHVRILSGRRTGEEAGKKRQTSDGGVSIIERLGGNIFLRG